MAVDLYRPSPAAVENAHRPWVELMAPAVELAKLIAGTDFVPAHIRHNPAAITGVVLAGDELGLGPMQSLAKIAWINGRPTLAAEAMRALILGQGHDLWIEEATVSKATVAGKRRDSQQTSRVTWTMDDARRAGLAGKPNYRAYPRQMLIARATAELARSVFADAIGGLMATEELEGEEPEATGAAEPPAKKGRRRRVDKTPAPAAAPTAEEEREPEEEQPPLPGEQGYELVEWITPEQVTKLQILFKETGMHERARRLAWASAQVGRRLQSSKELTVQEASRLIETLEQEKGAE